MTPSCSVISQDILSNQTSLVMLWLLEYNDWFEYSAAYSPLRPTKLDKIKNLHPTDTIATETEVLVGGRTRRQFKGQLVIRSHANGPNLTVDSTVFEMWIGLQCYGRQSPTCRLATLHHLLKRCQGRDPQSVISWRWFIDLYPHAEGIYLFGRPEMPGPVQYVVLAM